jgi:asparagine synthase (glutamine-hydrolysing)
MCGIAGIFAYGGSAPPVDQEELLRIREAMIRRGPDGAGLWLSADRRVGLAHRRLAIIDLGETGAQPMATADGRLRITYNGEIYNYRELRKELEAKGFVFRSNSDTEVLLHLYAERGNEMVHALRGMYAFALWDDAKKGVFLARDPFGIKPLYYADNGQTLRVASQVKALVRGGGIDCHPEAAGYAGFLIWGCVPEPFTLHREIRAVPAGSHMWIDARGSHGPVAFFSVRQEFEKAEGTSATGEAQQILETLQDSIRHHMVADVPVAAFLSAGLDSATAVALGSRIAGADLRTLTLGFTEYQGSENDETGLAQMVAGRYGVSHETRWVTRLDFEADLDEILDAMDQPSTDGVNTYLVSKAAARSGMKVALSGLGGDELFAGYPSFRDVPRIQHFSRATRASPYFGSLIRKAVSPLLKRFTSPKYAGLLEYGQSYSGAYLLRRGLFMPWELPQIMEPELAARGWEDLQSLHSLNAGSHGISSEPSIVSALELAWYMRNQLLRDSDWAGMAHSVEIRVPYIDLKFFRAVLAMSESGKPLRKIDLAQRLDPPLPEEILQRSKTGFLAPVQEWCTDPSREGNVDRGLRGWARIVIRESLLATGAAVMRLDAGTAGYVPSWKRAATREATARASEFRMGQSPARRLVRRAQASMAKAAYLGTNAALSAAAFVLWPRSRPASAEQVCVYRIGSIGDLVCAMPAIAGVRRAYPNARLTLLTSAGRKGMPSAADVLAGSKIIDDLWVYYSDDIDTLAKRRSLLRDVRARRFDVWIDLPNNLTTISRQFRDMTFTWMAGAKWARGWRINTLSWGAQAQTEYLHFSNEVDRTLEVIRDAGINPREVKFEIGCPPDAKGRIDTLVSERVPDPERLIAIAPGAKRSTNLWMPERFAEVGRELAGHGYTIVLLGGRPEAEVCTWLAGRIGPRALCLAGELSVLESCELLRRCRLAVCLDSGVQHLASAVGTPTVSLFSFWQMRGKWHPYGSQNVVLQKWVACHTCLLEECPNGNLCMKEITVGDVTRAAESFLIREKRTPETAVA